MLSTLRHSLRPRPLAWAGSIAIVLLAAGTAFSATGPADPLLPFAEGSRWWSPTVFLSGLNTRSRIIPFCVVVMCLALFILMKKFAEPGSPSGPRNRP